MAEGANTGRTFTLDRAAWFSWRALIVLAALAVVVWMLLKLRIVLLPLLVALMVSTVLSPVTRTLSARGCRRGLASVVALLLAVAVIVGALALLGTAFASQADELADQLADAWRDIEDWLRDGPLGLTPRQIDELSGGAGDARSNLGGVVQTGVSSGVPLAIEILTEALLTLVFLFYLLKDGDRMWAWVLSRVPPGRRHMVDEMGAASLGTLSGFVRGTAITAFIDAVFIGVGFWLLGVPLVVPIAVLTFFAAFVPIVGATVAGIVGVLIALADGGITKALLALGVVILVQQLEGNLVQPVAVGRRVSLHPLVTLAAVAAGTALGGIVGGFVAVPLVAVVYGALEQLRRERAAEAHQAIVVPESPPSAIITG